MNRIIVDIARTGLLVSVAIFTVACTVREERPADTSAGGTSATAQGDTAAPRTPTRVLSIEGGFQTPESVLHDADQDVYFVSNINGNPSQKDNNGFISRVRPDGTIDSLRFIAGGRGGATLHAPKGMAVRGDTLWVADIDAVRAFNKRTGASVASVSLTARNARFLNDVALDPEGAVYITDTGIQFAADGSMTAPGPFRIFRIAPQGRAVDVAIEGDSLARPNGIAWDSASSRFIVAPFGGNSIMAWTPGRQTPTLLAAGPGQFDGVVVASDGRIIVSSWADSSVHVLTDGTLHRAIPGVNAPADIGWDARRNRVLIPLFMDNRIEIWELASGAR